MAIRLQTLVLSFILSLAVKEVNAQPIFYFSFCETKHNYSSSSDYKANLDALLSALPSSDGDGYGFYNLSHGGENDRVYSIALCRGDVAHDICHSCLENATKAVKTDCPNEKEAGVRYELCMLRYADRSLYGKMETSHKVFNSTSGNLSSTVDRRSFNDDLQSLLARLRDRAAGGSIRKFATGNTSGPEFYTIYALVQCTPDLSRLDCNNCLDSLFVEIPEWFPEKSGARAAVTSCVVRFETFLFYQTTEDTLPPLETSQANGSNKLRTVVIVIVSISALVVSMVLIISVCTCLRKKNINITITDRPWHESIDEIESTESLQYSFETIRLATNNFSEVNKLGHGGFGPVYKGRLLDGQDIAVKRLSTRSGQGDLEFKNEVTLLSKLQHRNLVKLLGFCLEGSERLIIYEFVPNTSLDLFIFDPSAKAELDWDTRYKIMGGIARGLLYLHEDSRLRIIHRDLKSSNILLDEEMNPKISDFGLARLVHVGQTQGNTSRIVGTYGYMAPEYALHGQFSAKSDVFSFGVLVLEILSGHKNSCFHRGDRLEDLLSYVWRNWMDGTVVNIVDPLLRHIVGSEIVRCVHIALLCTQENVVKRPTMNTVVVMLNSNTVTLPLPSEPALYMHSDRRTDISQDFNLWQSKSDHSKSESAKASSNEASVNYHCPH